MPHLIVTTDVQNVSICQITDSTFSIMCTYLSGSDARGCVYTLVSGVDNIAGSIERGQSVEVTVTDVQPYIDLLAHDWESDNSIGNVPVRGINAIVPCPTSEPSKDITCRYHYCYFAPTPKQLPASSLLLDQAWSLLLDQAWSLHSLLHQMDQALSLLSYLWLLLQLQWQ